MTPAASGTSAAPSQGLTASAVRIARERKEGTQPISGLSDMAQPGAKRRPSEAFAPKRKFAVRERKPEKLFR